MSLTVKSLNGDTAFLLTFGSPLAPLAASPGLFPGPFTILVDPWLTGPATILGSFFSISEQRIQPCISSLKELEEPDLIIISQDKPDHCHEETLRQLPSTCQSTILAIPAAAKKIRSWKHFREELVHAIPRFDQCSTQSFYRLAIPPVSPRGSCGELTVTWIPAKRDISSVHHAIGITYRPPCGELAETSSGRYLDLPTSPLSPPLSPRSFRTISSSPRTIVPAPYNDREKTISVLYSPHGVPYEDVQPYASSHLVNEAALPLTALIHSFDRVENPWYLGGNISAGSPGGLQIARSLYARTWISAHDADKNNRGFSVKQTRIGKFEPEKIESMLSEENDPKTRGTFPIKLVTLSAGEEYQV